MLHLSMLTNFVGGLYDIWHCSHLAFKHYSVFSLSVLMAIFNFCSHFVIILVQCVSAVLLDITGVMFNKRFMDEVFKPQEVYPKKSLRAILERFAHASVMRLNPSSMDKVVHLFYNNFKVLKFFLCYDNDIYYWFYRYLKDDQLM